MNALTKAGGCTTVVTGRMLESSVRVCVCVGVGVCVCVMVCMDICNGGVKVLEAHKITRKQTCSYVCMYENYIKTCFLIFTTYFYPPSPNG